MPPSTAVEPPLRVPPDLEREVERAEGAALALVEQRLAVGLAHGVHAQREVGRLDERVVLQVRLEPLVEVLLVNPRKLIPPILRGVRNLKYSFGFAEYKLVVCLFFPGLLKLMTHLGFPTN